MPRAQNATREKTKSTAMPLVVKEALLRLLHSTKTCPKKCTIRQVPQEAVIFHPKQMSCGVHGAPKMVVSTSIQPPTALC